MQLFKVLSGGQKSTRKYMVERVHQVIYNTLINKDLSKTLFKCIDTWD